MEKIFYIIHDAEKRKKVEGLCRELGMKTNRLFEPDLVKSVGQIAGMPIAPAKKVTVPPFFISPEIIIFCGLNSQRLDVFLAEYKKAGIEPVKLKAVMTAHNISWDLYSLINELLEERKRLGEK